MVQPLEKKKIFDNPLVLGSVMNCGQGNKIRLIVAKLQPLSATASQARPAKACVTGQCVHTYAPTPKSASMQWNLSYVLHVSICSGTPLNGHPHEQPSSL